MRMNNLSSSANSFSGTIMNEFQNSLDIENSSFCEKYENQELQQYFSSSQNIVLFTNILMNKYYDKIKKSCQTKVFSKEENIKYRYRPEALSSDIYNTTGLWYLILRVNSCEDFSEFYELEHVLLPDINTISECLINEEYILKKDIQ